ncbi:MAG: aryl-sulfate sulfotransferase [Longimicrobiales bacterium]
MKRAFLFVMTAVLTWACDSPTETGPPPAITNVVAESSGPLFRHLNVTLAGQGGIEVTYWTEGRARLRVRVDEPSRAHRVFLPRLASERTYTFEVRSLNARGESSPAQNGTVTTGALPAELAALRLTARGRPTQPLTMVELMITNTGFNGAFIADADGEIVWYWRTVGWINGVSRLANGNMVMLDADSGLVELAPDASVMNRLRNGNDKPYGLIHHDAIVTPQNRVLFLARDPRTIRDTAVVGEAIWEWQPQSGVVTRKWTSFDHFDWSRDRGPQTAANNWMHANSLMVGARGNVIVSARNLDEVFSIAPDFRSIEWRLGGPNPTLQLAQSDRFFSQHSAVEVAPHRILLFDNGLGRPGAQAWSRIAEYTLDPSTARATLTWQYRPQPDINALRVGSVVRLANGNTVAAFGWGQGFPIAVYEVSTAGQVLWSLTGDPTTFNRVYRMKPLGSIAGEVEVE